MRCIAVGCVQTNFFIPCFHLGDRVTFVADRAPTDTPTKWIAKQVVVNEDTTNSNNGEKIL